MIWIWSILIALLTLFVLGKLINRDLSLIAVLGLGFFSANRGYFGSDSSSYFEMYKSISEHSSVFLIEPGFYFIYYALNSFGISYQGVQMFFGLILIFGLFIALKPLNKNYSIDLLAGFFATGYYAFLGGQRQALALMVLVLLVSRICSGETGTSSNNIKYFSLAIATSLHYSAVLGMFWVFNRWQKIIIIIIATFFIVYFDGYFKSKINAFDSFDIEEYMGFKRYVPILEILTFLAYGYKAPIKNLRALQVLKSACIFAIPFATAVLIDPQFANLSGRTLLYFRTVICLAITYSEPPTWFRLVFLFGYVVPKSIISYSNWFFNFNDWGIGIQ